MTGGSDHLFGSGIAGGVVTQPYFQTHFGMLNPDGSANVKKTNDVSSNVVSVLQAGAFFGALGSAPISNRIGRRLTLLVFTLIFALGAVSFPSSSTLLVDSYAHRF
jgi:MFS family permease